MDTSILHKSSDNWLANLRSVVAGRRVTPSFKRPLDAKFVDTDETLVAALDADPDDISGLALLIVYRDAKNNMSERRVTCRCIIEKSHTKYLFAWCHERNALRQFALQRIQEAVELVDGEVVDLGSYFESFKVNLKDDLGLQHCLKILTFLMRCDGRVHPSEKEEIESFITSYIMRFDASPDIYEPAMKMARSLAPDSESFMASLTALKRMKNAGSLAKHLKRSAGAVIAADKVIRRVEFEWMVEVEAVLNHIINDH